MPSTVFLDFLRLVLLLLLIFYGIGPNEQMYRMTVNGYRQAIYLLLWTVATPGASQRRYRPLVDGVGGGMGARNAVN